MVTQGLFALDIIKYRPSFKIWALSQHSYAPQPSDSINVGLPGARLGALVGRQHQVESTFEEETHL